MQTVTLKLGLLATGLLLTRPGWAQQRVNSQVQVARQFWLAAVGQQWRQAYDRLSPAARAAISRPQFRRALQPLQEPMRRYGPVIDLYKLGYRLRDTALPETFIVYSFRADTLAARPHVQLYVSFPDSTARLVQSFRVVVAE